MTPDDDYVAGFLREADRTRYFATLFAPAPKQPDLRALFAFSADVAAIRDRAREPAAGEIRLQWWVDAIKGAGHGDVRANPLAAALLDVVERHALPTGPLLRLLAARRFDLYQDPMPDVASFEGYAGETVSVLYQLAAMILAGSELENGDAAGHLGVADALVGHLRAMGYNASRGRIFLPLSVFAANGVTEHEILSGTETEGLFAARDQLAEMAQSHLRKAVAAARALPVALRPAFAPLAVLPHVLGRTRRSSHPFATAAEGGGLGTLLRMARFVMVGP